jgi:hypothetical protein
MSQIQFTLVDLRALGRKHNVTGRSKKALWDALAGAGVDVEKELGNKGDDNVVEDNASPEEDERDDDAAQFAFADLRFLCTRLKLDTPKHAKKVALLELLQAKNVDISGELDKINNPVPVSFNSGDLLSASMSELRVEL